MKKLFYLVLLSFMVVSCSKEENNYTEIDGNVEVDIIPSIIEIGADACAIEFKVENYPHLPHLNIVWDFEYTEDWTTKPVTSKNLKMWGNVNYSTDGNYPGVCSNTENPEEMIVTDGELLKQSATVQIPKNTTGKKRCFYLRFSGFCEYGFVRILQHEK